MDDIIFEVLKLVVMAVAFLAARYFIPWLKTRLDMDKVEIAATWAGEAVLWAQQALNATGAEKKAIVTEFLKGILTAKNIALSDGQLDVLIESAVKQMKMGEE